MKKPLKIQLSIAFLGIAALALLAAGLSIHYLIDYHFHRFVHQGFGMEGLPGHGMGMGMGPKRLALAAQTFSRAVNLGILFSGVAAGGIAFFGGMIFARKFSQPIEEMTVLTGKVKEGDLNVRISLKREDELGTLAKNFNAMVESLAAQEKKRRELMADIAHELRTPLTALQGYLLAFEDETLKPVPENLAVLSEEVGRLQHLVGDLQELAKLENPGFRLQLQRVDIALLCQELLREMESLNQKDLRFFAHIPDKLPVLFADPFRLKQILTNLLENAVRHTPPKGQVGIRVEPEEGWLLIKVWDTGEGIPEDELPCIFERFYRVDKSRHKGTGGVGLGLSIVKKLAEAHGGKIEVESILGQGTTFIVRLPLSSQFSLSSPA